MREYLIKISKVSNTEKLKLICKKCNAKCCKPTLVPSPFNLNLCSGDFSALYRCGYGGCLGVSDTEGTIVKCGKKIDI